MRCHFCREEILSEDDIEIGKINNRNYKFHKSKKCYEKRMEYKHKCAYCKEYIHINDEEKQLIKKENKYFHKSKECYKQYLNDIEKRKNNKMSEEEKKDWDSLYEYVRVEILGYDKRQKLNNHIIMRLQGLRFGKYKPRKNDLMIDNEGYPYKVILSTFKLKKLDILKSINMKSFDSDNGKFDYIIAIISNSINDVYKRYKYKEQSKEQLYNLCIDIKQNKEFNNNKLNNDKVANLLTDLF